MFCGLSTYGLNNGHRKGDEHSILGHGTLFLTRLFAHCVNTAYMSCDVADTKVTFTSKILKNSPAPHIKGKGTVQPLMEVFHGTATECHLPYGITQCYLLPDTSEHTPP